MIAFVENVERIYTIDNKASSAAGLQDSYKQLAGNGKSIDPCSLTMETQLGQISYETMSNIYTIGSDK